MGMPNRDEVNGKYEAVIGAVKEKVGHLIDDKNMERQGAAERDAGDARQQVGKVKRKVGEVIEDIGEFVRK
ncbi:MAG TPA: CsbD family protein [Pyrinomonadaceae bacterium]|nr:CsbD family protein [Pyrinomonadaceae bacterium]